MSRGLHQNRSMTDEQSQTLTEFISDYDTSNLSKEDATKIVWQMKELGINPGVDLAAVLKASGIDAKGLAEQARVGKPESAGGPPGGRGGQGGQVAQAVLSLQVGAKWFTTLLSRSSQMHWTHMRSAKMQNFVEGS